jgi:hypothetical protein
VDILDRLFGQRKMPGEKKVGKATVRGRSRAPVRFVGVRVVLTVFLLLFLGQIVAAQGTYTYTFSPTGSMGAARGGGDGDTLTRLCDDRVLAAGGSDFVSVLASAELYDPAFGTWTPTGSMTVPRHMHSATLLDNCKVLVAGGYNSAGAVNSAELYDPASGTWSTTGSFSEARLGHTAVLLNNGKVLIAAGLRLGIIMPVTHSEKPRQNCMILSRARGQ